MVALQSVSMPSVGEKNNFGYCYVDGDGSTDGSKRLSIEAVSGHMLVETRINSIWQLGSIEAGADTVWAGKNVGISGVGHHLATKSGDDHLHFHAHSEFVSGLTAEDAKVLYSFAYDPAFVWQPDNTGAWTGTVLEFQFPSVTHAIVEEAKFETGPVAASDYVRLQIYKGSDAETGLLIFDQKYPASNFPANTVIDVSAKGYIEFDADQGYFHKYTSSASFSLKMESTNTVPWMQSTVSWCIEDNLLQTKPWQDGDTWTAGDYYIDNRLIYICRITGAQSGTFASNSDKWQLLGVSYAGTIFPADSVAFAGDDGHLTGNATKLKFDPDVDVLYVGGVAVLTSYTETDPIFSAWNRSTGISITESQISDLSHTPAFTGNIAEIWNSAGDLKIMPDVQGDVVLFGDTDVGDGVASKMLYVHRKAVEGDDYLRFYIHENKTAYVEATGDLGIYSPQTVTIQSLGDNVILRVGDDAGVKKAYFKNGSNGIVGYVDSLGKAQFNVSVDVPEIFNAAGDLKVQPDVQGDVVLFGDTDVGDAESGKMLYIKRQAVEGNDYVRIYVDQNENGMIHASSNLTLQGQQTFTINAVNQGIVLKVGDNAGAKKVIIKDSDGTEQAAIDSDGNITLNGTVDGIDIAALDTEVGTKAPQSDAVLKGDLEIQDAMRFHDQSTQNEGAERNSSLGHTHTAIPNGSYDSSPENISERGLAFSSDGYTMYICGISNNGAGDGYIWEYPLTTPWDLSTVGTPVLKSVETYSPNPTGICFSPNGRTMYLCDAANDIVSRWTSILAWNIATFNYVEELSLTAWETSPAGLAIMPNGKKLFVIGAQHNDVTPFVLNTAWELGDVIKSTEFGTSIDNPTDVQFNSDGRRMYVMDGSAEDDIHEYHLAQPWQITTAVLMNLYDVSAENASPQGIFLKPDNATIYMVGTSTPEGVYAYDLGIEVGGAIISNKGPMIPGRMTTTERDAMVAVDGMFIYNTTTNTHEFRRNGAWV